MRDLLIVPIVRLLEEKNSTDWNYFLILNFIFICTLLS